LCVSENHLWLCKTSFFFGENRATDRQSGLKNSGQSFNLAHKQSFGGKEEDDDANAGSDSLSGQGWDDEKAGQGHAR
jgi:hypothetical protein